MIIFLTPLIILTQIIIKGTILVNRLYEISTYSNYYILVITWILLYFLLFVPDFLSVARALGKAVEHKAYALQIFTVKIQWF